MGVRFLCIQLCVIMVFNIWCWFILCNLCKKWWCTFYVANIWTTLWQKFPNKFSFCRKSKTKIYLKHFCYILSRKWYRDGVKQNKVSKCLISAKAINVILKYERKKNIIIHDGIKTIYDLAAPMELVVAKLQHSWISLSQSRPFGTIVQSSKGLITFNVNLRNWLWSLNIIMLNITNNSLIHGLIRFSKPNISKIWHAMRCLAQTFKNM